MLERIGPRREPRMGPRSCPRQNFSKCSLRLELVPGVNRQVISDTKIGPCLHIAENLDIKIVDRIVVLFLKIH